MARVCGVRQSEAAPIRPAPARGAPDPAEPRTWPPGIPRRTAYRVVVVRTSASWPSVPSCAWRTPDLETVAGLAAHQEGLAPTNFARPCRLRPVSVPGPAPVWQVT